MFCLQTMHSFSSNVKLFFLNEMSIYRFLPLENISLLRQAQISRSTNVGESCVLLGENTRARSSLLFQAAVSIASEGDQVIFICPRPFSEKPYFVTGMTEPSPLVLQSIKIIYISNPSDLLKYLCEFHHTTSCLPSAILVDEMEFFVSCISQNESGEAALVKLIAIFEDTVGYISQKKGGTCHSFVSLSRGICPKDYVKRFFKELWSISGDTKDILLTDEHVPAFRVKIHVSLDDKIVSEKVYRLPSEADSDM